MLDVIARAGHAVASVSITYRDAGVDIQAGNTLVDQIKPLIARTTRPEVLGGLGGFAGLCTIPKNYRDPVLVSGTDGVGTKLKTAFATERHRTVGIDLVAMVANDVAVVGAEPLFFLDYFATGRLLPDIAKQVIEGMVMGCQQAGCALLGGETAELPGLYKTSEYDLAGFCVGVVERDEIRNGKDIQCDDLLLGLRSSGLHSNGHSLAQMALLDRLKLRYEDEHPLLEDANVADALLEPTKIYVQALSALRKHGIPYRAAAHITGGGLVENCPRMLRTDALALEISLDSLPKLGILSLIASAGVEPSEMRSTFNMGIGMVITVAPDTCDAATKTLQQAGESPILIGKVVPKQAGQTIRFV